jgi:4-aminobutyrate aminotransferase-like enzyme
MIGVEIITDRESMSRAPELRNRIVNAAFSCGLLLLGAGPNTIRFVPPLNVTQAHADEGLALFEEAVVLAETT